MGRISWADVFLLAIAAAACLTALAIGWSFGVAHGEEMCRDVQGQQLEAIDGRTALMWQHCRLALPDDVYHSTSDPWSRRAE